MKIINTNVNLYYFIIFFICVYTIYMLSAYRCKVGEISILEPNENKDNFFKKYKLTQYGIDTWSVIHFLFYGFVGYLYPQTLILTMILGILWEIFEFYVGKNKPSILKNIGFCSTDGKEKIWWYGKISDIIVNYIGFIIGKFLKIKKISFT